VRDPHRADDVVDPAERPEAPHVVGADDVRLDVDVAAERHAALELGEPLVAPGDDQRPALLPVGAVPGLALEARVELRAVLHEPGHRPGAAEPADQPGRMPRRAGRQALALEQHDVGPAEPGEVIGDAGADDAAADDHRAGVGSQETSCGVARGRSGR
jgi:hypothetical protein